MQRDTPRRRLLAAATARFFDSPNLSAAAAAYCAAMLSSETRAPLRKLLNQVARYEICVYLIANHTRWRLAGGPPPTLALLATLPLASPRQTAAFVATLRRLGVVRALPDPSDRRQIVLQPAPELIEAITQHPCLMIDLHDHLVSGAVERAGARNAPADLEWLTQLAWQMTENDDPPNYDAVPFPTVMTIAGHDSGYLILVAVMAAHYAVHFSNAPTPLPLTGEALAPVCQVSRAHVAGLLRKARANNWFAVLPGGERVTVAPSLVAEFETFLAEQAAHFGALAAGLSSTK